MFEGNGVFRLELWRLNCSKTLENRGIPGLAPVWFQAMTGCISVAQLAENDHAV
jgi:hypothetical protein